jgi:hypothetical protein
MKPTLPVILIASLSLVGGAQEEIRAHIPYKIPDGTPPPPEPPKPVWTVPATDVVSEKTHPDAGRTITVRQIKPIPLPEPTEPPAPVELSEETRQRMAEYLAKHPRHQMLGIGATVYRLENDVTRTLVRVWITGQEPVSFWSSGDFSLLSGVGTFIDNQGETRALFMMWSIFDSNRFAKRMAELGKVYSPPAIPELPSDKAAYLIHEGEADDDLLVALDSLHEILNHDEEELRTAYEGRERAAKEREEYLKANPPAPKDIILNYWRTEKPAAQEKGAGQ